MKGTTGIVWNETCDDQPNDQLRYESAAILELGMILFGKYVGKGASRTTYVCNLDETKVIKVEQRPAYQNIVEWELWTRIQNTPLSQFFAPCRQMSTGGVYLIQEKCEPLPATVRKIRVPAIIRDVRRSNFGVYKGRVVCFDYGASLASLLSNQKISTVTL